MRWWRPAINRTLRRDQKIVELDIGGVQHVQRALAEGAGVLVTPNHSFHYDSYVLIEASHRVGTPFHFLTAWQVFAMSRWYEQLVLQWHGCFSVNREASDLAAFKTAVDILREKREPLVIFPEGDIYHNNDRVTPFRDGAAAIAISAAKKAERPIVCVPCALKCFYLDDPTDVLKELMSRLEQALHWRPRPDLPLPERIYRFAEGSLALKEYEYLGQPQSGSVPERATRLADQVLSRLELRHGLKNKGGIIPERVKEVRRAVIKAIEQDGATSEGRERLQADMEDLFFVIQLFSYPGDYVSQRPSIERIAETLDKFEEDVLQVDYPAIRGTRKAVLRFGEPIPVPKEREAKNSVEKWTDLVESRVQGLLDEINCNVSGE
ncbi:MAG TPA: 1-acyl-sn-glycerol-3-phosphate acyltransferase [Pirellulaceae bacterium]|nr:1-acyl-sn-glycerol-3-phosphate acyltransferase [Pirellulaceae bacterium]